MEALSLIPPVLAITIAIWKKEVILALFSAIIAAEFLLNSFNPWLSGVQSINRITSVFESQGNTEILLFSLLIGALLALIRQSGGVISFINYLTAKRLANSQRSVGILTTLVGFVIFIESNLSILASGIFAQNLFDRFKLSRARLAFIIDSTCAPVSVLILLNGWGAYILALLDGYGLDNPVSILVGSIPLNFYAFCILALVFYTAWSTRVHFTLAKAEQNMPREHSEIEDIAAGKSRYFLVPLLILIFGIIGFMLYTGDGVLIDGSGSTSVLYATVTAILSVYLMMLIDKKSTHQELVQTSFKGMGELLPMVSIVLLALALGNAMNELGTGQFVASMISDRLPIWSIPPVVFIAAATTSFTTGTSWGTFGLLIPVAIPIALVTELPPSLLLAAVLSGGVFGDHCSPISDSTVLSSLASGTDHLLHVRTQLPYALLAASAALIMFLISGLITQYY